MAASPRVLPIVAHYHRRDVGPTEFSSELHSTEGRDDLSSVDQLIGTIEQLQSIEEKRPLLWIKERESLVEQDLSHISFDLREIRIDRPVESEILSDSPPHVAT